MGLSSQHTVLASALLSHTPPSPEPVQLHITHHTCAHSTCLIRWPLHTRCTSMAAATRLSSPLLPWSNTSWGNGGRVYVAIIMPTHQLPTFQQPHPLKQPLPPSLPPTHSTLRGFRSAATERQCAAGRVLRVSCTSGCFRYYTSLKAVPLLLVEF